MLVTRIQSSVSRSSPSTPDTITQRVSSRGMSGWAASIVLALFCSASALFCTALTCVAEEADLQAVTAELLQNTQAEQWDDAMQSARSIAATEKTSVRSIAALIQLARRLDSSANHAEDAADVHDMAAYALMRLRTQQPEALNDAQAGNLLLGVARGLSRAGRHTDAHRWLTEVQALEIDHPEWIATCMTIASGLLDEGQLESAEQTYTWVIESGESPQLATARLGRAWCVAMSGQDDPAAIEAINQFLQHHPDHADVPSALLMRMSCQSRSGQTDAADQSFEQLIRDHADSGACLQAIVARCNQRPLQVNHGLLAEQLITRWEAFVDSPTFNASLRSVAMGLLAAAAGGDADAESAYADSIAKQDETGDITAMVLEQLVQADRKADAERIAVRWIALPNVGGSRDQVAATGDRFITAGVRESACRWAGRTGNWSMLAAAAKDEETYLDGSDQTAEIRGRNLHVERLFAEGLLQTGDAKASFRWWKRIVDDGGAEDFPTLLRLAETASSSGTVTEAAQRIAAARAAISPSSPQSALVNLLAADVEIRQLNFDRGRSLLESVVRLGSADEDARGRAQWMIGETYYMQERFTDAIDAYRLVEGISGDGQWTAAALVQAGKSFEQLGRTREAAVCYSTLVRRFANSQHANGARRRLAALSPDASSESPLRR
ncbi:tetratricopeptide repeat protein [Rhodopirellula halodulae]|uniref:tetratricopeptide repeat protein n=1 Tax=Rhodopirellula halodulae TaxID=2894198 RepID=UPI001E64044A|nr:tetratricopeptide repeat protein [Rhodopirellula sp. JC737]MCC9655248.1 tetratricopeptide repeat protein [Rhodopirellula sp. JC737]